MYAYSFQAAEGLIVPTSVLLCVHGKLSMLCVLVS